MQTVKTQRELQQATTLPYPESMRRALGTWTGEEGAQPVPFSELAALCPIGAFDSGMGGLSIVSELRSLLPHEDIIFYADSANCPYGPRPDEWLRARCVDIAGFLVEQGAKIIVVACNAASAAGLEHLRARFSVPVVGLVPAVKPAVALTHTGRIGVLATKATNRGHLLADVIGRFATPAGVEVVTVAPDGLVQAVESGELDTRETEEVVRRALQPMLDGNVDAIVLGCTHYPFLKPLIRKLAGNSITLIDSGEGVSRQTARVLDARRLLRQDDNAGSVTVYTSGMPEDVAPVVHSLLQPGVPVLHDAAVPRPILAEVPRQGPGDRSF